MWRLIFVLSPLGRLNSFEPYPFRVIRVLKFRTFGFLKRRPKKRKARRDDGKKREDPVKSGDGKMAVESSQMQDGTGFPRLRVFIISFANLKDSIKMTDVRVRVTLIDPKGEIMEREVCVPNSDGLNVSKDGFLAIRSGITI